MAEYGPQFGINITIPFTFTVASIIEGIDDLMTGEDTTFQDDIILTNVTINELMYHVREFKYLSVKFF